MPGSRGGERGQNGSLKLALRQATRARGAALESGARGQRNSRKQGAQIAHPRVLVQDGEEPPASSPRLGCVIALLCNLRPIALCEVGSHVDALQGLPVESQDAAAASFAAFFTNGCGILYGRGVSLFLLHNTTNLYFSSVSKTEILTRLFVQQFFADIVGTRPVAE